MNKKEYEVVHFITDLTFFEKVTVDGEDLQALREYLKRCEKLQEENERLKNDKKKVLELIENDYFEDGSFENYYEVLNILQGSGEE